MGYNRLHAIVLAAAAAGVLACPAASRAAVDCGTTPCTTIQQTVTKESFKISGPDLIQYRNRGWPVPSGDGSAGSSWVPDDGKGPGLTIGGAGGYSYGSVRAPESPPGSRNETASISAAAITSSCNFPPRITLGFPPKISMPSGTCLNFLNGLFQGKSTSTTTPTTPPTTAPVGVAPTDTCPADSNNAGLYGTKVTASATPIPAPCGGMVPIATADLSLVANPTNLATTTDGSYFIWTYRKSGSSFTAGLNAVALPSYFCGAKDKWGNRIKTVDLPPPTEQMIEYKASDGYVAIRLQGRDTMPSTYIPPYVAGAPEQFLVLPLNGAGDPIVPANCSDPAPYYKTVALKADYLIQSANTGGATCAALTPTVVDFPWCSDHLTYAPAKCPSGGYSENFVAVCNPPPPPVPPASWPDVPLPWAAAIKPDLTTGKCPGDPTGLTNSTTSAPVIGCTPAATATDASCDVITMPVPAIAATPTTAASCQNMVQYAALNRPSLFYPAGTSAVFDSISGRTQLMAQSVANARFYMQTNTAVLVQSSAPATVLTEGGSLTQNDGNQLSMSAPATLNPGANTVTLTNGGQVISPGGTLITSLAAGSTYSIPGGAPYNLHVGRSMTFGPSFLLPTPPTTSGQAPYLQLPVSPPAP